LTAIAPSAPAVALTRFGSPNSYTPQHLAERILTSKAALEGERKQVTVLFADLKGSMELLAERDPEEARKILDPVLDRMMEAVHRYEGTVNQVMGDGIMALFGAPIAHEDHAVRACYAALRMQQTVKTYAEGMLRSQGLAVQIRVGLNSGEVVVRTIGSDLRMDYTAVGQTTHLAARMEQLAVPGTILVSPETLRLAEGYIAVTPRGPVPVRGLDRPVAVYEVTGAGPARTRLQAVATGRGFTRFVGREVELEHLRRALELAGAGHGQVAALVGEAGVGKSRLVYEFTHSHRTQGWLILEAASASYGKATNYLPVGELLKGYFKVHDRDDAREIREKVIGKLLTLDEALKPALPAFLPLLDVPVDDAAWGGLDPGQRRARTLDALKRLLLREAREQPLLLVFEDLHWIDSETQALLDSLVDSLGSARVLLLVNYRPEYQHGWSGRTYYSQLRLDALPPESTGAVLNALLGDDASLEPLKQLLGKRGNPFFLEETVRTLVETKALVGDPGRYRLAQPIQAFQVPATVQTILAARIDRLDADDKRLLQVASVIGKDVPVALLETIAGFTEEGLRRGLGRLQAAEFLYERQLFPDIEYSFKHALTHEVTYAGLLQDRRRALHGEIVEAIERLYHDRIPEWVERLAHHSLRAEDNEKAVDYLIFAAAKAYERGAVQESIDRSDQALDLAERLPRRPENLRRSVDVRLGLYTPLFSGGQIQRLVELMKDAEQLASALDDQPRLARVLFRQAALLQLLGDYQTGLEYARRILEIADAVDDPELRVLGRHVGAMHRAPLGQYRLAVQLLGDNIEGVDAPVAKRHLGLSIGSPYTTGAGYAAIFWAQIGDFARARSYSGKALEEGEALDHARTRGWAYVMGGFALGAQGQFEQALGSFEKAASICEAEGITLLLPGAQAGRGWALAWSGRALEGLPYLEWSARVWEAAGVRGYLTEFLRRWAEGLLLAGSVAEAREVASKALDLAVACGERGQGAWALHALGTIAEAEGGDHAASDLFRRGKTIAEECEMAPLVAHCYAGLARVWMRSGDRQPGQESLAIAAKMYRDMDMRFWLEKAEKEPKDLA
jgi:class 3 adenylate cyclase/tetratricopeptide (TPR) repeat protein